jgi:hypothetical protein
MLISLNTTRGALHCHATSSFQESQQQFRARTITTSSARRRCAWNEKKSKSTFLETEKKERKKSTTTMMKATSGRGGGIFLEDSGRGKFSGSRSSRSSNNSSSTPREMLTDEFGGGGNFGGGGDGGSGWNNNNNNNNNEDEDEDEQFFQSSSMATRFLLIATVTSALTVVPLANAKSSANATANKMKAQTEKAFQSLPTKAKDFFTAMLYGFVIFFGVKMALKSLFAPVALFSFTMFVLHNMKVLPFGPIEMYESWVRPYLPREFQKDNFAFLHGADTMSEKYTKAFWSAAHRILPACNSSHGEKALIIGMLLAGLV